VVLGQLELTLDAYNQVRQLCYSPDGRRNALGLALLRQVYVDLCQRITALGQGMSDLTQRVFALEVQFSDKAGDAKDAAKAKARAKTAKTEQKG
jgi:hypothetical protein